MLAPTTEPTRASPADRARARHRYQVAQARENSEDLIEYALHNTVNGRRIENAWFHREWQQTFREHKKVVLISSVEHAKTQQIAVGKVLHLLGQNPNATIAIVSKVAAQAEKSLRNIRTNIEQNRRLREVFPDLKPSGRRGDPWTQANIIVERPNISNDPSVQALGAFGPINGSRLTDIILDDVLCFENTRTPEQRNKLVGWIDNEVQQRGLEGANIWAIGTPWHQEDALHQLSERAGFVSKTYPAVYNPLDPPEEWKPIWPEQWPLERLLDKRQDIPETDFARQYLCQVRLDATSRFKQAWMDNMCRLGVGRTFLAEAPKAQGNVLRLPCFTGVDLGIGEGEEHARTVMFTAALMQNGRRLIVDIQSGHWQFPEILDRLQLIYNRYGSHILVESNGAQKWILHGAQGRFPVHGRATGANKHDREFGVESLALELRNNWWVMPSGSVGEKVPDEGKAAIGEALHYNPSAHTGDRLMAWWICREAMRLHSAGRLVHGVDSQFR